MTPTLIAAQDDTAARLVAHVGHEVEIVQYGKNAAPPWVNVSLECLDCGEVILDRDLPE